MSLSDKETNWMKETKWDVSDPENPEVTEWETQNGFETQDVKQFIKELKENINGHFECHHRFGRMTTETKMRFKDILSDVDERAGKELI